MQEAFTECEEEGRVAYVDTWYIHHQWRPLCREARALKLFSDTGDWLQDILALWEDVLDPKIPVEIRLVRPSPPCARTECVLAHLILEQAPSPRRVVGLITLAPRFSWVRRCN